MALNEIDVPSSTTDLGECELNTPHLALVAESVFTDDLQFRVAIAVLDTVDLSGASSRSVAISCNVQTSRLEGSTWDLVGLGVTATVLNWSAMFTEVWSR